MPGAILTYLEGWWARLIGRVGGARAPLKVLLPELRPEVKPESLPEVQPDPVETAEVVEAENRRVAEQSFLETVRLAQPPQVSRERAHAARVDPNVRQNTLDALEGLRQIPALQSLVQNVTRIMCRDGVCVDEVVEALQKDSALCVRVLTMANSAAVAPEMRIEDLPTAVQLIGIARVRRLAQAVFTMRDAQRMVEGLDWRHLWIHALATAAIAEELDRRLWMASSPQTYMAALLHDVGKIALSTVAADPYRDIIVASWNGDGRLEDLERERLGLDHREAGFIFARGNRLSDVVVQAIAHHDDPTRAEDHRFEVALVSAANYISKAHGLGFSGARLDPSDGELENLTAWQVVAEETGRAPNVAQLEDEMLGFITTLRVDMRSLHEGVG